MIKLTRQDVFETGVKGLFQQGKPAITEGGECQYRSEKGLKCAMGFIIPDHMYNEDMESRNIAILLSENEEIQSLFEEGFGVVGQDGLRCFLSEMQSKLHDRYFVEKRYHNDFKDWLIKSAEIFASKYDLDFEFSKELKV